MYVPAATLFIVANVLEPSAGHKYVNVPEPPLPDAETVPVELPKQLTGKDVTVNVTADGCVKVTEVVAVQPELSLTIIL